MRVVFHPEADAEFADAVAHYADIDPNLGRRFYAEMERLLGEIIARPKTFRQFDPPARRHFSARFPYGIVYLEQSEILWVVAVMHMKRRPGYWKSRTENPA